MKQVTIYTDGFCVDNPGRGGYGAVLIYGQHRKELLGGYRLTTNNRMELMAAIKGLQALKKPCEVTLYSDSKYLVEPMADGRVKQWQTSGWRRKKRRIKNVDLWEQLLELCDRHQVEFVWVKGHAGLPENERADRLSMEGADCGQGALAVDANYENNTVTAEGPLFQTERDHQPDYTEPKVRQPGEPSRPKVTDAAEYIHPLSQQSTPLTELQQAIIACVHRFPGELSRTSVGRILVGSHSTRVDPYRKFHLFGRFRQLARDEVVQHTDYLIVLGLIFQEGKRLWPG